MTSAITREVRAYSLHQQKVSLMFANAEIANADDSHTQPLKPSMGRLPVVLRGLTHPWFLEPWGSSGGLLLPTAPKTWGWWWARCLAAPAPCRLIIKQRSFGQETRMPNLMTYISCTAFLLHHSYCLHCTLLGLINIPHLLCNVFSPCKTAYFLLASKLHTCQSG